MKPCYFSTQNISQKEKTMEPIKYSWQFYVNLCENLRKQYPRATELTCGLYGVPVNGLAKLCAYRYKQFLFIKKRIKFWDKMMVLENKRPAITLTNVKLFEYEMNCVEKHLIGVPIHELWTSLTDRYKLKKQGFIGVSGSVTTADGNPPSIPSLHNEELS
jgi:hypothetical protein